MHLSFRMGGKEGKGGQREYSQGLHVCFFIHVPHLHGAVVGSAVEIVASCSEGKSLGAKRFDKESHEEAWPILYSIDIPKEDHETLPRQGLCVL